MCWKIWKGFTEKQNETTKFYKLFKPSNRVLHGTQTKDACTNESVEISKSLPAVKALRLGIHIL